MQTFLRGGVTNSHFPVSLQFTQFHSGYVVRSFDFLRHYLVYNIYIILCLYLDGHFI